MVAARAVLFLIEFIFGVVEFFIALRVLLKLLGASPQAPFVAWVYDTSQPLLAPFSGMFPAAPLQGRFVLEFSALFGLVVYAIVAYMISEIVRIVSYNMRHVYTESDDEETVTTRRKKR